MSIHRLWGVLLSAVLLQACWDDAESPTNRPPDLRMEDVVGCWTRGDNDACSIRCFDPASKAWRKDVYPGTTDYEEGGSYRLDRWQIVYQVIGRTVNASDSISGTIPYRRVGPDLYTLTPELQLGTRFTPVNLDSTLPCGTPFQLLPKPAGWTLF